MWEIDKTTKSCRECSKSLGVNEDFFSALFYQTETPTDPATPESGGKNEAKETDSEVKRLGRLDFCSNCWERKVASGEEAPFSFWHTKYTKAPEPPKTPRQVLVDFFNNMFEPPQAISGEETVSAEPPAEIHEVKDDLKDKAKYLFSLILLRKKILKLKDSVYKNNIRHLVLERAVDNRIYEVPEANISEQELESLRDQFSNLFEFRI